MSKICLRCGKKFEKLAMHLSSVKCKSKYLDLTKDEMLDNYDKHFEEYKNKLSSIIEKKENGYECEYCHNKYLFRNYYYKHKKYHCQVKKNQEAKQVANGSLHDNNMTNTSTVNNITNNGTFDNSTNIDNSTNVTIFMNNFGEEAPLSVHDLVTILNECLNNNKLDQILPMYVKKRWIDNEYNRTIDIRDMNRGIAEVYVDKDWEKRFLNDVIEKIRLKSTKAIKEYLIYTREKIEKEHNIKYQDDPKVKPIYKVNNHIYDIENEDDKKKDANKKIKYELVNNRNKVRETKNKLLCDGPLIL